MTNLPALGKSLVFNRGFAEFLANRCYAIVAIHDDRFLLVEIDFKNRSTARVMRVLSRKAYLSLANEGYIQVKDLPSIPTQHFHNISGARKSNKRKDEWVRKLAPFKEDASIIFSANDPVIAFNHMAKHMNLNVTRARENFFWYAAYGFEEEILRGAYWNCGSKKNESFSDNPIPRRGRPLKDPSVTLAGWAYDRAWEEPMLRGWTRHIKVGKPYIVVYTDTLTTEFGCLVRDEPGQPAVTHHPEGRSFPKATQYFHFIKKLIGAEAWRAARYGTQTVRNRAGKSHDKASQFLINLLEEVQWDAQILDELPGDLHDPTISGKPIIRVVAICCTCGGPVGVGYDYGAESQWAYLMALLSMAMKKSEFCALFGVDKTDQEWPATGIMLSIRGDRGPAIAQKISDMISVVLEIWQEWAASYDPVGKASAEAGHYKHTHVEGAPVKQKTFRSPLEIIRDDLRKTVTRFRTSDMSRRLDPDQARRLTRGTPLTIWNDLAARGLYAGQHVPYEKLIPHTVPRHPVTIDQEGVWLGGLRYLSKDLLATGLLERARGNAIDSHAYAANMAVKMIWLDLNGRLMPLTAVPVRVNSMDVTHNLTLAESMLYLDQMNRSRRFAEQEKTALDMADRIEATKDRDAMQKIQKIKPTNRSKGKKETIEQHEKVFKRKA
jgi:hypothetical protein